LEKGSSRKGLADCYLSGVDAVRVSRRIGRYTLCEPIAAGGMATVHLGILTAPGGFVRPVAIKRLHTQYARDPEFVAMFLDEARLAARVRHPNVVLTLDVLEERDELFLVMDYIHGESLNRLTWGTARRGVPVPVAVCVSIIAGALRGLHAAHEATSMDGKRLEIVHRDVSPHNIIVGVDGIPRVLDFGIAKAADRQQLTREGRVRGKLGYMAPEYLSSGRVDRRVDVYGAAVSLWETLAGRRLFLADNDFELMARKAAAKDIGPPSRFRPGLPPSLDNVVMRGLASDPEQRFATALDMAVALEEAHELATASQVGAWVNASADQQTLRTIAAACQEATTGLARMSKAAVPAGAHVPTDPIHNALTVEQRRHEPRAPSEERKADETRTPSGRKRKASRGAYLGLALVASVLAAGFVAQQAARGKEAMRAPAAGSIAPVTAQVANPPPSEGTANDVPELPSAVDIAPSARSLPEPAAPKLSSRPPSAAARISAGAKHAINASNQAPPAAPSLIPVRTATCDPPYTIDRDGFQVLKPECLSR
jgi:serine/threonine protein kinase